MEPGSKPIVWRPHGVSDTVETSSSFQGAMAALTNLIPDPSTPDLWVCRPAAVSNVNYGPGVGELTVAKIIGTLLFGLYRSVSNPGFDQPFAWNLLTNTAITVTGITTGNVPASLPTTGAWTPPIMDVVGSKVLVAHVGFASTANFFGWFDIANPAAPVWHAGNLTGAIAFTSVPVAVAQFSNRAYWVTNPVAQPAVVFTDTLNPINCTAATQVLTFNDNVALTAIGQLRLFNLAGGVVQGLAVFKGVSNIFQITGDAALNNLFVNSLSVPTGTFAPWSVCATQRGLAFMSPDGLRFIDYQGNVSDPQGVDGSGVCVPFINSVVPSRMVAACNGRVIRITTKNGKANGTPNQEFWFDIARNKWSGPHTFPAAWTSAFQNTFLMTTPGVAGTIFQSDIIQSASSVYVENGTQLMYAYATSFWPDLDTMTNYRIQQAVLECTLPVTGNPPTVTVFDPNGVVLDSVTIPVGVGAPIWGGFNWGAANWGGVGNAFNTRQLQWHGPIVFTRMQVVVNGPSNAQLQLGAFRARYKPLKFLADIGAVGL